MDILGWAVDGVPAGITPGQTDLTVQDAIARWTVPYLAWFNTNYPGMDLSEFRLLANPDTPFQTYLPIFDKWHAAGYYNYPAATIALLRQPATVLSKLSWNGPLTAHGDVVYFQASIPTYYGRGFYAMVDGNLYLNSYEQFPEVSFGGAASVIPGRTYFSVTQDIPKYDFVYDPVLKVWKAPLVKIKWSGTQQQPAPTEIWDSTLGKFVPYPYIDPQFRRAFAMQEYTMSAADKSALAMDMASSGLFKAKTEYITIGDEIPGEGTIDFKSLLQPEDYIPLMQYLTFMPRQFLRNFFMTNIYPQLPLDSANPYFIDFRQMTMIKDPIYGNTYQFKPYMNMVWQGFVDLFNVANLEYINTNQVDPWEWEDKKFLAYNTSQSAEQMTALQTQFDTYSNVSLALDPKAKVIMDDFATLPKLGDLGHEINRQNAVKELLKHQEYELAQAIVDAFRYAKDTVLGPTLEKPFTEPVVLSDGQVLAMPSTPSI